MSIEQDKTESVLKRCIKSLEDAKNVQALNYLSMNSRTTYSGNLYDSVVNQVATTEYWRLTATPKSGKVSLIDMKYWFRLDNANVMASPQTPTPTAPIVSVNYKQNRPAGSTMTWDFIIRSNLSGFPPPHNIYFKFMFSGTDDIVWSFVKL